LCLSTAQWILNLF